MPSVTATTQPALRELSVLRNIDPLVDPICRLTLGAVVELDALHASHRTRMANMLWSDRPLLVETAHDVTPDDVLNKFPADLRESAELALQRLNEAGYVRFCYRELVTDCEYRSVIQTTAKGMSAYRQLFLQAVPPDDRIAFPTIP